MSKLMHDILCCMGIDVDIVSDTVRVRRYEKFQKPRMQVRLYIINTNKLLYKNNEYSKVY
jgi:hypothetical protein